MHIVMRTGRSAQTRRASRQAQLRDSDDEAEEVRPGHPFCRWCSVGLTWNAQGTVAAADEKLVRLMQQDAVIRKVALTYVLQRVTVGDLTSAEPLLLAAKEASACACSAWVAPS